MPSVHKILIGGGGDDWISHIVKNYEAQYRRLNPAYRCSYFSWTNGGGIRNALLSAPRGANVTVIGHSYGADAAFSAIQARSVNTLISIDPVGRVRPPWATIRTSCQVWLNARAEPAPDRRTSDDRIAAIGGQYRRPPAIGQLGAPNHSVIVNATHGDFRAMMRATLNGVSGKSLLGGRSVF